MMACIHGFRTLFLHRRLLVQHARRQIAMRYRGSLLGVGWSFVLPLLQLLVFTFVFGVVFKARWHGADASTTDFAVQLFAGMILHAFLMDVLNNSVATITSNPNFVKKVVFPLEVLVGSLMASALFHLALAFGILLVFMVLNGDGLALQFLWVPVYLLPFFIFTLGAGFLLAALGVYLRDLVHLVNFLGMFLLFTSTIFFPIEALPEAWQPFLYLNPLTWPVTTLREILFAGMLPQVQPLVIYSVVALLVLWLGMVVFAKSKRGFADVL